MVHSEQLHHERFRSFRIAKIFREHTKTITSLRFDDTGDWCMTAGEDESLQLYDCRSGKHRKTIYSKKYGVDHVRFTHSSTAVIHSSTKGDDHAIRYLNLHDNKYLRYFQGHSSKVSALEMSPVDDLILSSAINDTARLWDLRQSTSVGYLPVQGRATVAFDPDGLLFAVGNQGFLKLYDIKSYSRGPFLSCRIDSDEFVNMEFSRDGNRLLIGTRQGAIHLVDAFEGSLLSTLHGPTSDLQYPFKVSFTPDSQYIIGGSRDGSIRVWHVSGESVAGLPGHSNPPLNVQFNPKFMMMASACSTLAFWIPDE